MSETVESVECVVVGAGVVGLAIARRLVQTGRQVIILEQAARIGTGTSSRNSEVIHAGLYYPPGSLKAQTCVAGRHKLYAFCESHGVAHARTEKLIVATSADEVSVLRALQRRAVANGVDDLQWIDPVRLRRMEPEVRAEAALLSPSTGIIDSHAYMLALQGDYEAGGGVIAFLSPLTGVRRQAGKYALRVGGETPMTLICDLLINAAGLQAQSVARSMDGPRPETTPPIYYARGHYFTLAARSPFRRLIYPVPEPGGIGIHATFDLNGQTRFGPDVEWIDEVSYDVDPARAEAFYSAIRRYWPGLPDGALHPAYAGIRPKLSRPGDANPVTDFLIHGGDVHGMAGVINLYGIESPGLTASLALAEWVEKKTGR
jgi:L-2-hydroxyglutarate oxidase LhgO